MPANQITPVTASDDGEIVVFLIGAMVNKPWKIRSWLPVAIAMPRMLRELAGHKELGLLSSRMVLDRRGPTYIQYWRSVEQLEAFARGRDHTHLPAWAAFMKSAAASDGAVGIWHETYVTRPGQRENIYFATPRFGFATAASSVEPVGNDTKTAKKRRAKVA